VKPRVLFVEDEESISGPFSSALRREGFDPVVCGTLAEARAADERATSFKSRFVSEFNDYAQKYLQRSYDPAKF
jgi:DNA-binding NtrC family response regulator